MHLFQRFYALPCTIQVDFIRCGHTSGGGTIHAKAVASGRYHQALFALAEADPALTGSELIVADAVDGRALPDLQGPMRLVAPHDTRAARAVRMLERIEVVRLRK